MDTTLRVALAGGGTGGHIIPALAIAEGLQRTISEQSVFNAVDFLFFGSDYGMETKLIPEAGFTLETLPIRGISRSLSKAGIKQNLLLPGMMAASILKANKAIRAFNPHITVGTGGYASAVPVRQSLRNNIPVVLQEQNSYPGLVTRLFAAKAQQVFLTYEDAVKHLKGAKTLMTGNPIRHLGKTVDPDVQVPGRPFKATRSRLPDTSFKHDIETHTHVGTHVEAPAHYFEGGKDLTAYNISRFAGPLSVIT